MEHTFLDASHRGDPHTLISDKPHCRPLRQGEAAEPGLVVLLACSVSQSHAGTRMRRQQLCRASRGASTTGGPSWWSSRPSRTSGRPPAGSTRRTPAPEAATATSCTCVPSPSQPLFRPQHAPCVAVPKSIHASNPLTSLQPGEPIHCSLVNSFSSQCQTLQLALLCKGPSFSLCDKALEFMFGCRRVA